MNHGFLKVATAIPNVRVADCTYNASRIKELICKAFQQDVQVVCFPELSLTAYTCADLFHQHLLISEAEKALQHLVKETAHLDIVSIVGLPVRVGSRLFNCAVVFKAGTIIAVVPKTHLPNYNEFYEKRWFVSSKDAIVDSVELAGQVAPFGIHLLIGSGDFRFSIELC